MTRKWKYLKRIIAGEMGMERKKKTFIDINEMGIKEQKSYYLVYNLDLSNAERVLISWQDKFLQELIWNINPSVSIDCLMEMDFASFLREIEGGGMNLYDYILDNGLLAQSNMDNALLRSMGLHLRPHGKIRTVLPFSLERNKVAEIVFFYNFENARCLSTTDAGEDSFYIAELYDYNQSVAWLQSFYTLEIRQKLAYLLLRLDFGFEVADTCDSILYFCKENGITKTYLSVMIDIAAVHSKKVKAMLGLDEI